MDTTKLISDAKARFSHNSAKAYLNEKYNGKLLVAVQNGLWRAAANNRTLNFFPNRNTSSHRYV